MSSRNRPQEAAEPHKEADEAKNQARVFFDMLEKNPAANNEAVWKCLPLNGLTCRLAH